MIHKKIMDEQTMKDISNILFDHYELAISESRVNDIDDINEITEEKTKTIGQFLNLYHSQQAT